MNDITDPPPLSLPPALAARLAQRPLVLGTRQSPLAMAQARETADRLRLTYGLSSDAITLLPVVASGDKVQDRALRELGGKELWTRELDRALVDGDIDFAVHSMKDVETVRPAMFHLAAILPRADVRDVLLGADSIADIPQYGTFGTSSPRRAAQMLHVRPDLTVKLFRGNVATRMARLANGEADATLLAAAGLARLDMQHIGAPLDTGDWLPAASQGAIGMETLSANKDMTAFLSGVNQAASARCVSAERAFLERLGGNCHSPVAAYAKLSNGEIHLRGELYSENGADKIGDHIRFMANDDDHSADLAAALLHRAPRSIQKLFTGI